MSEFKSYSQSGQDRFCYEVISQKTDGTFLDVGSGHVTEKSNTYGLEKIGWRGACIDLNPQGDLSKRDGHVYALDATAIRRDDWFLIIAQRIGFFNEIDYLSLDVDSATLDVLKNIPTELRFKVITIENDSYRFGTGPRDEMRKILTQAGYDLICADVRDQGLAFEDWFCAPSVASNAEQFRCSGKDWKDIFK